MKNHYSHYDTLMTAQITCVQRGAPQGLRRHLRRPQRVSRAVSQVADKDAGQGQEEEQPQPPRHQQRRPHAGVLLGWPQSHGGWTGGDQPHQGLHPQGLGEVHR